MQLPTDTSSVLNGSYIVFACVNGYINNGGSLNVTCSASGTWSQFPNCVVTGQPGNPVTTPAPGQVTTTAAQTSQSCTNVPTVANAYVADATTQYSSTGYVVSILYACNPGFVHVNTSGSRRVNCSSGVWSTLPVCVGMLSLFG